MEGNIQIEVDFLMSTIAGTRTRCNTDYYIFSDFRDVERVEDVEKYVKKLLNAKNIRDLTITFQTSGESYGSIEGTSRIIREFDGQYRIIQWPARNVIDDKTTDKISAKDIRKLYLDCVERFYTRFPEKAETA